jgi:hypothetical protein
MQHASGAEARWRRGRRAVGVAPGLMLAGLLLVALPAVALARPRARRPHVLATEVTTTVVVAAPPKPKPKPKPKCSAGTRPPSLCALAPTGSALAQAGQNITTAPSAKKTAPPPPPSTTPAPSAALTPSPAYPPLPGNLTKLTAKALNSIIDLFGVPPFLLPIYHAAADDYGVPWQVLAAINEVETDYGRNLSISSAGAIGWMQFLPSTWARYGVDADGRGSANPYDPIDAIFAAARYLRAAGAGRNLSEAIFAYNHASWYVNSVLLRATLLRLMPPALVDGLTGLMEASFPIAGHLGSASTQAPRRIRIAGQPAVTLAAPAGAPVIAVADGHVIAAGHNHALGRFVTIEDSYGNRFTYARLGTMERVYPVLEPRVQSAVGIARELDAQAPRGPGKAKRVGALAAFVASPSPGPLTGGAPPALAKERLFANPLRPASYAAGGWLQLQMEVQTYAVATALQIGADGPSDYFSDALRLRSRAFALAALRPGATLVAGTVLGHVARRHGAGTGIVFQVRPAGASAPVDPSAIIAGWELLGRLTAGRGVLAGVGDTGAYGTRNRSIGQLLLANKSTLERAVLSDPNVSLAGCARQDIRAGRVDRRVLAVIEYLSYSGFAPGVSGLVCGEPNGSEAQAGTEMQISQLDRIPVAGHQREGGIVDLAIRALVRLQGALAPSQIISGRSYPWQPNITALSGDTRLGIDFTPSPADASGSTTQPLNGAEWLRLDKRLAQLAAQPGAASPFATRTAGAY